MKQYFTGFFTAVCLTASVFIFMGTQNKNLGDIVVNSISIKSENGETNIYDGYIQTNNADGKLTAYLGTGESGGGHVQTFNADGKLTTYLGTGNNSGGHVQTHNADGKQTAYLGTGESGSGFLATHNTLGVMTGYFGTNQDNDGIVTLSDRYGDKGWRQSGKQ